MESVPCPGHCPRIEGRHTGGTHTGSPVDGLAALGMYYAASGVT